MNPTIDFTLPRVALDYETFPIGTTRLVNMPDPVVLSIYDNAGKNFLTHVKDELHDQIIEYLLEPGTLLVGHNLAFDLGVIYAHRPDLITKIFDKLERGECYCTLLAAKLMNLSSVGIIESGFVRNKFVDFRYDLAKLAFDWLGIDMSEDKRKCDDEQLEMSAMYGKKKSWTDKEITHWDSLGPWRVRYKDLYNFTDIDRWPSNAKRYALMDTEATMGVAEKQIAVGLPRREGPFNVLGFQIMCQFAFTLRTSLGVYTDSKVVEKLEKWVDENLTDEVLEPLKDAGIYIPAHNGRPYKNNPEKFTKPEKAKTKEKPLKLHIANLLKEGKINEKDIAFTDGGRADKEFQESVTKCKDNVTLADLLIDGFRLKDKKYKDIVKQTTQYFIDYLSVDKNFQRVIEDLDIEDPILTNFTHYKKFSGLKSNSIPVMKNEVLYPQYDVLKKTGRTSSKGFKKGKEFYPSCNIQQINSKIREAYKAREGYRILATDYTSMELITAAQICYTNLGESKLREIIIKGYDAHAYLGAQIASQVDDTFIDYLAENPELVGDHEAIYKEFWSTKGTDYFKKYRTLAKPTGLGYWGALGYKTFIKTAKTTYRVEIESEEMAALLKNIWHEVFPETEKYFKFIRKFRVDGPNTFRAWDEDKQEERLNTRYVYDSPYGMLRKNCKYTEVTNGMALQTPGGEGAKTSMYLITRACFDPSKKSVLYGGNYIPWGFIHDEEVGDVKIGKEYEVEVEIDRLMRKGFEKVCPDVPIKTECGLMNNWSKLAESKIDHKNKTVTLWEPKSE